MKTIDILNNVNKSNQFKSDVDTQEMGYMFNLNDIPYGEQERLTSYYIGGWYCTDSYVGYKVYFLDDVPVAISSRIGRKCSEEFEWVSKELYLKVRDYLLSLQLEEIIDDDIDLLEDDQMDSYKIYYNGQLFEYHFDIPFYHGAKVKIIELIKDNTGFDIGKEVRIEFEDTTTKVINVGDLDFPFNLINNTIC